MGDDADPDWSKDINQYIRCCTDHDDEELTLVCTKCNVPACSWCFLDGAHVGRRARKPRVTRYLLPPTHTH